MPQTGLVFGFVFTPSQELVPCVVVQPKIVPNSRDITLGFELLAPKSLGCYPHGVCACWLEGDSRDDVVPWVLIMCMARSAQIPKQS